MPKFNDLDAYLGLADEEELPPDELAIPDAAYAPPDLSKIRAQRDQDLALTDIMQSIGGLGNALSGSNQAPDNSIFDSQRKAAIMRGSEAGQDAKLRQQGVMAAIKAKAQAAREKANQQYRAERDAKTDEYRRQTIGSRNGDKRERQIETDTRMLSDKLSGAQESIGALGELDNALGFPLDSAETKSGKLVVGGKEKDLPGVSVPGIGRVTAFSGEARALNSAASRVFNAVLKDRSGAAVTNPELTRLKEEFNQGRFNSEPEIIAALQRYKRGVAAELKNREAGFSPEAVDRYASQGGVTSRSVQSGPQTKIVNGVQYQKVPGGWQKVSQ